MAFPAGIVSAKLLERLVFFIIVCLVFYSPKTYYRWPDERPVYMARVGGARAPTYFKIFLLIKYTCEGLRLRPQRH